MIPEAIPASAYTHLNYAFAFVDPNSFAVAPMSDLDTELFPRFTGLKTTNPGLQTWISIGGWSMNDPDQPTHETFSTLAGSADAQSRFFSSLISFMTTYSFDGVDIDWEYPVAPERSGNPQDYQTYVSFLSALRQALGSGGHNYGLSITIPSSYWYMQHFDIIQIANQIDFFNVMTYDLHGTWDSTDKFIGPVINAHTNLTEIDQTMDLMWRNNIDPSKINLGLGFYGRSFTLTDPSCTSPGCPFSSGGTPGACTDSAGTLSYAEIEREIAAGAKVTLDSSAAVKIVTWGGDQWVSYDDQETLKMKIDYANSKCLGGTMVWAVSTDDAQGSAAAALSASTGRQALNLANLQTSPDAVTQCIWGECGQDCPSGTTPAQRSDGSNRGNVGLWNGCAFHNQQRNYCCPPNSVPTCQWRGTAPFCNGKCHDGEVEVTTDNAGTGASCATGHKALCCSSTASDSAIAQCSWHGTAPHCASAGQSAGCPSGLTEITRDSYGSGGDAACYTGAKSFCCPSPPPFQNCDWYAHGGKIIGSVPFICGTPIDCPVGQYAVASDPSGCTFGTAKYFCCDAPGGHPELDAFQDLLDLFKNNPTCSGGLEWSSATKRQSSLTGDQLSQLVTYLTQIFLSNGKSSLQVQERQAFDQTLGPVLGANSSNFQGLYGVFPGIDSLWITQEFLCQGMNAATAINQIAALPGQVCQLPSAVNPAATQRRPDPPAPPYDELRKRYIDVNLGIVRPATPGHPPILLFLLAILNNDFTFLYSRITQINANDINGGTLGRGLVEIAWLMGNDASNINSIYQSDHTGDPDVYFVMHFHIDHILDNGQGQAYPGVYLVDAFHGQRVRRGTGVNNNRIDGRQNGIGENQQRAVVFQCENDEYWYPGREQGDNTDDAQDVFNRFGSYLRTNRYLHPDLFLPVVEQGGTSAFDDLNFNQLPGGQTQSLRPNANGGYDVWQASSGLP